MRPWRKRMHIPAMTVMAATLPAASPVLAATSGEIRYEGSLWAEAGAGKEAASNENNSGGDNSGENSSGGDTASGTATSRARLAMAGDGGPPRGGFSLPAPIMLAEPSHYDGDYLIVAAGGGFVPDYDGSRHLSATPGLALMGRVGNVSFSTRAAGIAFDFIPDKGGKRVTFSLGPEVRYSVNRHGDLRDPAVAALGKLSPWWEAGISSSVSVHRVLTGYDSLSFGTNIRHDISGHDVGWIVAPSVGYMTPVSKGALVSTSFFADFVDKDYARYNYAISAAGAAASGLPAYDAHGGLKDLGAQAVFVLDFDGDLLDGGLAFVAGAAYTRLEGSAAETPITSIRGTPNQWSFGAGLAYSF